MSNGKPVVLTIHAAQAVSERELRLEWIESAARACEWSRPDPQGNEIEQRFRAIPEYENRILRVACLESATEIRIITAFFDRKAKRPA
jgi:Domain of unknown function (DUF4258)